jgi:hypothetical protein
MLTLAVFLALRSRVTRWWVGRGAQVRQVAAVVGRSSFRSCLVDLFDLLLFAVLALAVVVGVTSAADDRAATNVAQRTVPGRGV